MEHMPFEEWLLSGEELSIDQQKQLAGHLASCPECTRLSSAWDALRPLIQADEAFAPEPGFTGRFQTRLARQQAARRIRITWLALLVCTAGILITAGALALPEINGFPSPIQLTSGLVITTAQLISNGQAALSWILTVSGRLPIVIPVIFWMAMAGALLLWSLVWMIGVWRIPHMQRSQNENN